MQGVDRLHFLRPSTTTTLIVEGGFDVHKSQGMSIPVGVRDMAQDILFCQNPKYIFCNKNFLIEVEDRV